jgi:hypothetical protein
MVKYASTRTHLLSILVWRTSFSRQLGKVGYNYIQNHQTDFKTGKMGSNGFNPWEMTTLVIFIGFCGSRVGNAVWGKVTNKRPRIQR